MAIFRVFSDLSTQWVWGMNGPVGMNYLVVFALLDRLGYEGDDWHAALDDIRRMERAALEIKSSK